MIEAVVFDLDGVLIDSEATWSRVRAAVVARHGGHWTEDDQRNVMGDNSRQWSAYIKRTWSIPLSEEQIFREVLDGMVASYERGVSVLPGARNRRRDLPEARGRRQGRLPGQPGPGRRAGGHARGDSGELITPLSIHYG